MSQQMMKMEKRASRAATRPVAVTRAVSMGMCVAVSLSNQTASAVKMRKRKVSAVAAAAASVQGKGSQLNLRTDNDRRPSNHRQRSPSQPRRPIRTEDLSDAAQKVAARLGKDAGPEKAASDTNKPGPSRPQSRGSFLASKIRGVFFAGSSDMPKSTEGIRETGEKTASVPAMSPPPLFDYSDAHTVTGLAQEETFKDLSEFVFDESDLAQEESPFNGPFPHLLRSHGQPDTTLKPSKKSNPDSEV